MSTAKFAAELFELFRKASQEKIEVVMPDKSQAYSLRSRLNKLRVAMRQENHPMLAIAESVSIAIYKENENVLIASPVDTRYLDVLKNAVGEVSDASKEAAEQMQTAINARTTQLKPKKSSQDVLDFFNEGNT